MLTTPYRARIIAVVAGCAAAATAFAVTTGGGTRTAHAAGPSATPDTVRVDGTATVQGVPDRLTANFGVHVTRSDVSSALSALAGDTHRVFATLHHAGVANRDVQTTDLQVSTHYDTTGHPDGYDASETLSATLVDLARAGRTISSVAASAGNAVSVNGLSFDITDDSHLLATARTQAFDDAKARARQYADLAGRSLGAVQSIVETTMGSDEPMMKGYAGAGQRDASAPVPLQAGQQPVSVVVTVVWKLS